MLPPSSWSNFQYATRFASPGSCPGFSKFFSAPSSLTMLYISSSWVSTRFHTRISSMTPKKSCAPYSTLDPGCTLPEAPLPESKHPPLQSCSRPTTSVPPEGMRLPLPRFTIHTGRVLS